MQTNQPRLCSGGLLRPGRLTKIPECLISIHLLRFDVHDHDQDRFNVPCERGRLVVSQRASQRVWLFYFLRQFNTACRPSRCASLRMNDDNLLSSGSFVSLLDSKLNGVASSQPIGIHPIAEVIHMHEDVRPPIITSNETISLLMIEPLDITCYSIRHFTPSPYLINLLGYSA